MKPTSFRLPPDTQDRLKALARPRETMTDTLLRAITCLETAQRHLDTLDDQADRLDAIKARLSLLERAMACADSPSPGQPLCLRQFNN